jgi:ribosomal protein L11 methyltransferase
MEHPKKRYIAIHCLVREEDMDMVSSALSELPLAGIYEEFDMLTVWFPLERDEDANVKFSILAHLITENAEKYNVSLIIKSFDAILEENWNAAWEASIEPVWVNESLVLTPSWKAEAISANLKIIIDPQMSFGTGHHETTRMMAAFMQECVVPQSYWVDAGTGTGALAIIAYRCGASTVLAFDNDEWSVLNAQENLARNGIAERAIRVLQADVHTFEFPPCDGIAANLHKNLLVPNLQRLHQALTAKHGILLASGLLIYDKDEVLRLAQQVGFHHIQTKQENDWCALQFRAE